VWNLYGFNLKNIILPEQGLKSLIIDVSEYRINLAEIIPDQWNVDKYKVISKVIHQEVDLSHGEPLKYPNIKIGDRVFCSKYKNR
jgi:hypothetical protein